MAQTFITSLPDRGIVAVAGPDAGKLLQGLITNDMSLLEKAPAIFAALLSPQGKILFDFFVVKTEDGFLLEVLRERAADLVKRLTMYKLRANVTIREASDEYRVFALCGDAPCSSGGTQQTHAFPDPRLPAMGLRILAEAQFAEDVASASNGANSTAEAYHAFRIAQGVPEGGRDYAYGDTFPHEALFDQLRGASFTKGCYVGQEIVSRMEHRGTARKRIVRVHASAPLPAPGTEIKAGETAIGSLGSTNGNSGLALVRLDRAAEAKSAGVTVTANGIPLTLDKPDWASFALEPKSHD